MTSYMFDECTLVISLCLIVVITVLSKGMSDVLFIYVTVTDAYF